MKTVPEFPAVFASLKAVVLAAAVLGTAMLMAPVAQAFTFNDQTTAGGTSSDAASRFSDPADRVKSRMGADGGDKTTIRGGNTTLQIGGSQGSFEQRNSPNRYFSPDSLMGR